MEVRFKNFTLKTPKTAVGILILILAGGAILGFGCMNPKPEKPYRLEVIEASNGWFYEVYYKEQLLIRQSHIPGTPNRKSFGSRKDAERIGYLVINRLKHDKSPSVSMEDLNRAGIAY